MGCEDNFLRLDTNNYASEWEYLVENYIFDPAEIANIFKKGLISAEEYIYAIDYLEAKNVYAARANDLYRRVRHCSNNGSEPVENALQIMG